MELFSNIWGWVVATLGGVSIAGIVSAVIYGSLKGAFNKTIQKINIEKVVDKVADKQLERIKEVAFTQSIQPIVNSELEKITEQANKYIESQVGAINDKFDKVINVVECLASYFDNSFGVSEEAKSKLKNAIADARKSTEKPVTAVEIKAVVDPTKEEKKQEKEIAKKSKIER